MKKNPRFHFRFFDYVWRRHVFETRTLLLLNGMSNNEKHISNVTQCLFRYEERTSIHMKKGRCSSVYNFCYESWGWGRGKETDSRKARERGEGRTKEIKAREGPWLGDRAVGVGWSEPYAADSALSHMTSRPAVLKLCDLSTPLHD